MRQVLAWALAHDPAVALRVAHALGWWWFLRGRLAGHYTLLTEVTGYAQVGSDLWCDAQFLRAWAAEFSADAARAVPALRAVRRSMLKVMRLLSSEDS